MHQASFRKNWNKSMNEWLNEWMIWKRHCFSNASLNLKRKKLKCIAFSVNKYKTFTTISVHYRSFMDQIEMWFFSLGHYTVELISFYFLCFKKNKQTLKSLFLNRPFSNQITFLAVVLVHTDSCKVAANELSIICDWFYQRGVLQLCTSWSCNT